jgi:uncharacterized protein
LGLLLPGLAAVVGVLIGMVGVGGVLLPPGLVAAGLSPQEATATSTWAFLFTGAVGTVAYTMRGVVPWPMLGRLAVGLVPGAFAGARTNAVLPPVLVLVVLATLTLAVGVHALLPRTAAGERSLGAGWLVAVGAFVGFGSALTGTGGPVLLVPVLLALGVGPLAAVAVSQAAQVPVVVSGSAGYVSAGLADLWLGSLLGVVAAAGVVVGAMVATRIRAERLRTVVALACVAAGALLSVRAVALLV